MKPLIPKETVQKGFAGCAHEGADFAEPSLRKYPTKLSSIPGWQGGNRAQRLRRRRGHPRIFRYKQRIRIYLRYFSKSADRCCRIGGLNSARPCQGTLQRFCRGAGKADTAGPDPPAGGGGQAACAGGAKPIRPPKPSPLKLCRRKSL